MRTSFTQIWGRGPWTTIVIWKKLHRIHGLECKECAIVRHENRDPTVTASWALSTEWKFDHFSWFFCFFFKNVQLAFLVHTSLQLIVCCSKRGAWGNPCLHHFLKLSYFHRHSLYFFFSLICLNDLHKLWSWRKFVFKDFEEFGGVVVEDIHYSIELAI